MHRDFYLQDSYLSEKRFISYQKQIEILFKLNPKKVLEIGIGNGLVSYLLKRAGINVTTADNDKMLKPDVLTDLRKMPFENELFDEVSCFEVLEHLPFEDFIKSLGEFKRVSSRYVVISIPYIMADFYAFFRIFPRTKTRRFQVSLFERSFLKEPTGSQHLWEMGIKNYSRDKIRDNIRKSGLKIIKEFKLFAHFHYFFVLEKKKSGSSS